MLLSTSASSRLTIASSSCWRRTTTSGGGGGGYIRNHRLWKHWSVVASCFSTIKPSATSLSMSGRGAYYKNKYGGGGRGGGGRGRGRGRGRGGGQGGGQGGGGEPYSKRGRFLSVGGSFADLSHLLRSIDGRNYPTYHDLEREWQHKSDNDTDTSFVLRIGLAQSDPFAPPTRCQVRIPATQFPEAWPQTLVKNRVTRMAACDFLLRSLYQTCLVLGTDQSVRGGGGGWNAPKGGDMAVLAPTQHVLEQSAVQMEKDDNDTYVLLQMTINLPARGRTILGLAAEQIFCRILPQLVTSVTATPTDGLSQHVQSVQDQVWLQQELAGQGLVAFVPNGAVLPRRSGVDDGPLPDAVPFTSPPSLERSFHLPETQRTITGMGIPQGVTLICGGGFHGKSTILQALQWGIYPKIPGDGREFCVAQPTATTIRAEDGRFVQAVNIADFLRDLPGNNKDTTCFSTENASGSTSQASNIVEAIELGAQALLMDEDKCATNALIRDTKMVQLVASGKEPITPFVRIVRALYEHLSLSTILVMGGSGDYFEVADHVLVMDAYHCQDATSRAKEIVAEFGGSTAAADTSTKKPQVKSAFPREIAQPGLVQPNGKVKVPRTGLISYGDSEIDLTAVEQIVSASQTSGISQFIQKIGELSEGQSLSQVVESIDEDVNQNGLNVLAPGQFHGGLTRPRTIEVGAALNRLRIVGAITQSK